MHKQVLSEDLKNSGNNTKNGWMRFQDMKELLAGNEMASGVKGQPAEWRGGESLLTTLL